MPTDNWVRSRIIIELTELIPDFDFTNLIEEKDSIIIDDICFYLKKHWFNPEYTELWAEYLPKGKNIEKSVRIKSVKDLESLYSVEKVKIT